MKIAVLGATGPSGLQVVKEALKRGHDVTALVRNPEKLRTNVGDHEKLKVETVNLYSAESMAEAMTGHDAVLSCLGCPPSWFSMWSVNFYTDTALHIVQALRKASITRFVFMASWYTKYDASDPFIVNWMLKPLILGQSLKNMGEMEHWLEKECPDIEYTSVRPPQLTNAESSGKPVEFAEDCQKIAGQRPNPTSRQDVAKFMLDITEKGELKRKCVAIMSGK